MGLGAAVSVLAVLGLQSHRLTNYLPRFLDSIAQVAGDKMLARNADQLRQQLQDHSNWEASCDRIISQIETRIRA